MRAGPLRHRCKIYQQRQTKDSLGGMIDEYVSSGSLWAEIKSISGRTFLSASQKQAEVTVEIIIRYRSDIDEGVRLQEDIEGAKLYEVVAPLPDNKRTMLKLMCKTVRDDDK